MIKRLAAAVLLLGGLAFGQHAATLTWTASADATTGMTYNVYRATAACSTTPTLAKLTSGIVATSYTDTAVTVSATYCYGITAVLNGQESAMSNKAGGTIPVSGATVLVVVMK
jgi:fibronectin type 3 domain-containing protein